MNYREAIGYLSSQNMLGGKMGLERGELLLRALGNPQKKLKTVLVGGTSGKGSTTAMIASILEHAGYKVGRFTKPHLSRFSERIAVNGKEIPEKDLARIVSRVKEETKKTKGEKPTFFEQVVACALLYFAEQKVDFAIIEVGLGGRLDATNLCDALVSVITNISLEHRGILGDTPEDIAYEKAGIIKSNGLLITAAEGKPLHVFRRVCRQKSARMFSLGKEIFVVRIGGNLDGQVFSVSAMGKSHPRLFMHLLGKHQLENAACAVGAIEALRMRGIEVSDESVREGLEHVAWPGRMEVMRKSPLVMLDCAKDAHAMEMLKEEAGKIKADKIVVVISISLDKEYDAMLGEIAPIADILIASEHKVNKRAIRAEKIASVAKKKGAKKVLVERDIKKAVQKAMDLAGKEGMVLVTGSVFAVGEAREIWDKRKPDERNLNETPKK